MSRNILRIRPHHLVCMLNHNGHGHEGYEAFIDNFKELIGAINNGTRTLLLVAGPDRICDGLKDHFAACHCHGPVSKMRDGAALEDVNRLLGTTYDYGSTIELTPELIENLRENFLLIRGGCRGCQWGPRCTAQNAVGGGMLKGLPAFESA